MIRHRPGRRRVLPALALSLACVPPVAAPSPTVDDVVAALRADDHARARTLLDELRAQGLGGLYDVRFLQGVLHLRTGEGEEASRVFDELEASEGPAPELASGRALSAWAEGRPAEARTRLEHATRLWPEDPGVWANLGDVYRALAARAYQRVRVLRRSAGAGTSSPTTPALSAQPGTLTLSGAPTPPVLTVVPSEPAGSASPATAAEPAAPAEAPAEPAASAPAEAPAEPAASAPAEAPAEPAASARSTAPAETAGTTEARGGSTVPDSPPPASGPTASSSPPPSPEPSPLSPEAAPEPPLPAASASPPSPEAAPEPPLPAASASPPSPEAAPEPPLPAASASPPSPESASPASAPSPPEEAPAGSAACFLAGPWPDVLPDEVPEWIQAHDARVLSFRNRSSHYRVYLGPFEDRKRAVRTMTFLKKDMGIGDVAWVSTGPLRGAVSLGVYLKRESVDRRLRALHALGLDPKVQPPRAGSWLLGATSDLEALLTEWPRRFPEVPLAPERCPPSP